jgi:hypothetical protein
MEINLKDVEWLNIKVPKWIKEKIKGEEKEDIVDFTKVYYKSNL